MVLSILPGSWNLELGAECCQPSWQSKIDALIVVTQTSDNLYVKAQNNLYTGSCCTIRSVWQSTRLTNSVFHSFHSIFIKRATMLNCKLRVVTFPLTFWPEILTLRGAILMIQFSSPKYNECTIIVPSLLDHARSLFCQCLVICSTNLKVTCQSFAQMYYTLSPSDSKKKKLIIAWWLFSVSLDLGWPAPSCPSLTLCTFKFSFK